MRTQTVFMVLGGPLQYCTFLFNFDFYLTAASIYVYKFDSVRR
jgi:hypothetical protein